MDQEHILIVDDEEFNLDILEEYLGDAGYRITTARDGVEAVEAFKVHDDIDVIVLDRMMPRMDGMQFLDEMKICKACQNIPVIMQTAAASEQEIIEGIDAGVFYYLTKPYKKDVLLSIVRSAISETNIRQAAQIAVQNSQRIMHYIHGATMQFRTLEDVLLLAPIIAGAFPEPERVILGLTELMVNAVEHGNLEITHAEKNALVLSGNWHTEIKARLDDPKYKNRYAQLNYAQKDGNVRVKIRDCGTGFDYEKFLRAGADSLSTTNGRGIVLARLLSFDVLEYQGCGNEVICGINQ